MRDYLYNLAIDKYNGKVSSIIKTALFLLSLIYGLMVRVLIFLFQIFPCHLNCKVISIGNITLGGTGKTTSVEFITRYLKQQGHKVAILTRGYKRQKAPYAVRPTRYEIMGDEPYMLAKNLKDTPVIVDADRVRAARKAINNYAADTVILDDGFEQWKIKKDLEIVTVDAVNPFGNGHMIPRGILREPLSSLRRADIFLITKTNLNSNTKELLDSLRKLNPSALIFESIHKPLGFYKIGSPDELFNIAALKGKNVALFSGIADPESFESLIKGLGLQVGLSFSFSVASPSTTRTLYISRAALGSSNMPFSRDISWTTEPISVL